MTPAFAIAALIAVLATLGAITRSHPIHALLYLILSLLAVAVIFALLGAPLIAALEVITYAGAVMVLVVFVVMLVNPQPRAAQPERRGQEATGWLGALVLSAALLIELFVVMNRGAVPPARGGEVTPHQFGLALYGPYLLGVELASMLLLSALLGAWHIGRQRLRREEHNELESGGAGPGAGGDSVLAGTDRPSRPA